MNIRLANDKDRDLWDSWVAQCAGAAPYSLFGWGKAVEEAYGHKAYYLIAEDSSFIRGVMPLIYMHPPFMAGSLVSLPYCDVGEIPDDPVVRTWLIREAMELAQRLRVGHLELRSASPVSSDQCMNFPLRVLSHKVRMLLELPSSSEHLWNSFRSKLRSQITKAEKNGLEFFWGERERIGDFYNVFSRNMRDIGSPVHSLKWFKKVLQYFENAIRLGLVYYQNRPIGAGIVLFTGKSISVPWASTLREFNRLSPNMLLYWSLLKYAADSGYSQFDFGRSTPGESTCRFKEQWGAKPVPLYWNCISIGEDASSDESIDSDISTTRKTVERLWKMLPVSVANVIGPSVRKHISL